MKVIISGLPYFAKKMQTLLSNFDKQNDYKYLDTNANKKDKIKFLAKIFSFDVLYLISGALSNSKTVDIALKMNKKVVMHWVGTDITLITKNPITPKYLSTILHLCENEEQQTELIDHGVKAIIAPLMVVEKQSDFSLSFPERFSVLAYIGEGREKFYGIDTIAQLANQFPNTEFNIVGISRYTENLPNNIKLHGWVKNLDDFYLNNMAYIRCPKHDGLAFSVLEALNFGRTVFYNNPFPNINYFQNWEELVSLFAKKLNDFNRKDFTQNIESHHYIQDNFSKEYVLNNLITIFKK